MPLDAHSTRSTSGCDATATSPSRPLPAIVTPSAAADVRQPIDRGAGRHRDDARPVARDLLREQLGVLAGREADDLQSIGVRVDDGQRALADRAGGAEDGDALHQGLGTRAAEHAETQASPAPPSPCGYTYLSTM